VSMCEACTRDEHWNCGMQTWCECDCPGPGGDYTPDDSLDGEPEVPSCRECGCNPCCCLDSDDFCLTCGNLVDECECGLNEPLDDIDANTRGDIA
jgi:hypothetical protein